MAEIDPILALGLIPFIINLMSSVTFSWVTNKWKTAGITNHDLQRAFRDSYCDALSSIEFGLSQKESIFDLIGKRRLHREISSDFDKEFLTPFLSEKKLGDAEFSSFTLSGKQHCKTLRSAVDRVLPKEEITNISIDDILLTGWELKDADDLQKLTDKARVALMARLRVVQEVPDEFFRFLEYKNLLCGSIVFFFGEKIKSDERVRSILTHLELQRIRKEQADHHQQQTHRLELAMQSQRASFEKYLEPIRDSFSEVLSYLERIETEIAENSKYLERITNLLAQDRNMSDKEKKQVEAGVSAAFNLHTKYEINEGRPLGYGAVAVVYSAEHKGLKQKRALKILKPEHKLNADVVERFLREGTILANLRHPNIVQVYDAGGGGINLDFYLEMEYIEGIILRNYIKTYEFNWERVLKFIKQLGSAIQKMHENGIIHRDLNPRNIMIEKIETLKVMDFGVAKIIGIEGLTRDGQVVGTSDYMAPEQARGERLDERADIYSFGVILYELCTRHLPSNPPLPLRQYQPLVPEWLESIVAKCIQQDRQLRYPNIQEIVSAIELGERIAAIPKCFFHPNKASTVACSNCKKMICSDCMINVGSDCYCHVCAERVTKPPLISSNEPTKVVKPAKLRGTRSHSVWLTRGIGIGVFVIGLIATIVLSGFGQWGEKLGLSWIQSSPPMLTSPQIPVTPLPAIETGKGRIIFTGFVDLPEVIFTRKIMKDFLVGVAAAGITPPIRKDMRYMGINHFLLQPQWRTIEKIEGSYSDEVDVDKGNITWLLDNGASLSAYGLLFFRNERVPEFTKSRPFAEIKGMVKQYVISMVNRYPKVQIWDLHEPITQNCFGWTNEDCYDIFVSASKWLHEINPQAKVMITFNPNVQQLSSGLNYDPVQVMDNLQKRGIDVNFIGIKLFYPSTQGNRDVYEYPKLDWIMSRVNALRKFGVPVILCDVDVPGMIGEKNQWEHQANYLDSLLAYCVKDKIIAGATWHFIRDPSEWPYWGLVNKDNSYRPVANRFMDTVNKWNPPTTVSRNGQAYIDLVPGKYDIVADLREFRPIVVFRVDVTQGQTIQLLPR